MKPIRTLPETLDDAAPYVLAGLLALVVAVSMVADSCRAEPTTASGVLVEAR